MITATSEAKNIVCIVLPAGPAYSETFIKTQIERLSATVSYLNRFPVDTTTTCGWSQLRCDDTRMLKDKAKASLHRYLLNPAKKVYLRHFFKSNGINAVLAQYGMTGAGVIETCERLNLSLIVHFHGYDAYSRAVLERYEKMYKRMFAYSSAIVAVSKPMMGQLVKLGAPREKVFYNPYGVDLAQFKPAALASEPQILAVGRFVEKKAPYLTILAFKKVIGAFTRGKATDGRRWGIARHLSPNLKVLEYRACSSP